MKKNMPWIENVSGVKKKRVLLISPVNNKREANMRDI